MDGKELDADLADDVFYLHGNSSLRVEGVEESGEYNFMKARRRTPIPPQFTASFGADGVGHGNEPATSSPGAGQAQGHVTSRRWAKGFLITVVFATTANRATRVVKKGQAEVDSE